jgi:hypothetical protein
MADLTLVPPIAAAVAALASAIAAWRVPYAVAEFNTRNQRADREFTAKRELLGVLLENRAFISSATSVGAINAVVFVFSKSQKVRDAHKRFMTAANAKPFLGLTLSERYVALINAIVVDLGLDGEIAASDIDDFYFPEMLNRALEVQQRDLIARHDALTANNNPLSTSTEPTA